VGCDGAAFWHDRYGHQPPMTAKPGDGRLGLGSRPSWVRPSRPLAHAGPWWRGCDRSWSRHLLGLRGRAL